MKAEHKAEIKEIIKVLDEIFEETGGDESFDLYAAIESLERAIK